MTAALIVAAGQTGAAERLTPDREIGALPALKRIVLTLQRAGVERIVVACGDGEDKAEKLVAHMSVEFLRCPGTGEMLESVKTGLRYLQDKCRAVLVCHTDVPLFAPETVRLLLGAEGPVCVPACQGRAGHPIRLEAGMIPAILAYEGPGGLAGAIRAAGLKRTLLEVEDEGVLANVRDGGDYGHLLPRRGREALRPVFRVQLMRDQRFYGPGAHQLLQLTGETESLLEACRRMGISYSKGRKIISNLERQMDCHILESTRGGKAGGASTLTPEGRELIRRYSAFCREAEECLGALFEKHFPSEETE